MAKSKHKVLYSSSPDMFTMICESHIEQRCVREYRFHETRMWRFDYAIPAYKIAIEVEGGVWTGGRHTSSKGFLGDMEKYNEATAEGWKVIRCVPKELCSMTTIDLIVRTTQNSQFTEWNG